MKSLTLEEIRKAIHARWLGRGRPGGVKGITTDTRVAGRGQLFFALIGRNMDGHTFLEDAADAGCIAAVVRLDHEPRPEVARRFSGGVLGVGDTTEALGALAAYHRRACPATVIGVTGSNGKTTVKRMVDHILAGRMRGTCSPKSFNNEIGVPLTLLAARRSDDYVICEIGTNAPGEVATLSAMARPDIAVITSIGQTHLEKLGDIERIAAEKASILTGAAAGAVVVTWADSELLDRAVRGYDRRMIRFGTADDAELRLTGYEPKGCGQRFQLNDRLWVDLPLPGRHNALNALAAIAVAQRMGFSQEDAAAALGDFAGVEMRLEWIDCGGLKVINDAYNANPASMIAAADVLAEMPAKRRVFIAGDMRELGPAAEEFHLRLGRQIAERRIDFLIGIGPLGRYIAKGGAQAGLEVEQFASVELAADACASLLREGDVVVVKGSRAMHMETLVEAVRSAFDGAKDKSPQ